MFRNLAVTAVTGVLVACGYAIACNGPLAAAQPVVVNTSGIELAPAVAEAVAPAGVAAAVEDALQAVAQVITGKKKASSAGAGAVKPEEVCEDCCSCCSCDGCDCSCCSCCSGGGGGCSGSSCVVDDSPETLATNCGASDSYDVGFDDSRGRHDMQQAILEQTGCTPHGSEAEACTPALLDGHTPPDNATCSSAPSRVDSLEPYVVTGPSSMQWEGEGLVFSGQSSGCDVYGCEFDDFSSYFNGNNVYYDGGFVCN